MDPEQSASSSSSAHTQRSYNDAYSEKDKGRWNFLANKDLIKETHEWARFCDEYENAKEAQFQEYLKTCNDPDAAIAAREKARERSNERAKKRKRDKINEERKYVPQKKISPQFKGTVAVEVKRKNNDSRVFMAPQSKTAPRRPQAKAVAKQRPVLRAPLPVGLVIRGDLEPQEANTPKPPAGLPTKVALQAHYDKLLNDKNEAIKELVQETIRNPIGRKRSNDAQHSDIATNDVNNAKGPTPNSEWPQSDDWATWTWSGKWDEPEKHLTSRSSTWEDKDTEWQSKDWGSASSSSVVWQNSDGSIWLDKSVVNAYKSEGGVLKVQLSEGSEGGNGYPWRK